MMPISLCTAAIGTAAVVAVTFGISVVTPPRSGPFCTAGCFGYPFIDIASRWPWDYIWMALAILEAAAYLTLLAVAHETARPAARVWSRLALSFKIIASGTLIVTYYVQLSVVQASLLRGETGGLPLLTQYNPHGLFIASEEVSYLLMAITFGLIAPAFPGSTRSALGLRWLPRRGCLAATAAIAWFVVTLGHD